MRTTLYAVRTGVVAPIFVVVTAVLAGFIAIMAVIRRDPPINDAMIMWWSWFFLRIAGGRLETSGQEHIDGSGQYLFVANHESNLDIPVMFLTTRVPIRYLAKKELFKVPLLAQAMRGVGIVKTDRQAGKAAHGAINEGIADATARGHSLIIFPEGTRSDEGTLLPFKKGAFRIAIANELPIVPISIEGTWEMWKPGAKIVYPGRVRTVVHPPIPTTGLDLSQIAELSDRCRAIIAADLGVG